MCVHHRLTVRDCQMACLMFRLPYDVLGFMPRKKGKLVSIQRQPLSCHKLGLKCEQVYKTINQADIFFPEELPLSFIVC